VTGNVSTVEKKRGRVDRLEVYLSTLILVSSSSLFLFGTAALLRMLWDSLGLWWANSTTCINPRSFKREFWHLFNPYPANVENMVSS